MSTIDYRHFIVSIEETMAFYGIKLWPITHEQLFNLREAYNAFRMALEFEQTPTMKYLVPDYLHLAARRESDALAYGRVQ